MYANHYKHYLKSPFNVGGPCRSVNSTERIESAEISADLLDNLPNFFSPNLDVEILIEDI